MKQKMDMCVKRLDNSIENIYKLEALRFDVYGLGMQFDGNTLYAIEMENGLAVPYGFFINGRLVGGCYVSNQLGTLYIDQLFVHKQLQNTGLRVGRLLLSFVLSQKDELGEYFHTDFEYSTLEPSTEKAKAIYEKMGYRSGELYMRKALK